LGLRRNLDEIEPPLPGQAQGLFDRQDACLLAVLVNRPDFGRPDLLVDSCVNWNT